MKTAQYVFSLFIKSSIHSGQVFSKIKSVYFLEESIFSEIMLDQLCEMRKYLNRKKNIGKRLFAETVNLC